MFFTCQEGAELLGRYGVTRSQCIILREEQTAEVIEEFWVELTVWRVSLLFESWDRVL